MPDPAAPWRGVARLRFVLEQSREGSGTRCSARSTGLPVSKPGTTQLQGSSGNSAPGVALQNSCPATKAVWLSGTAGLQLLSAARQTDPATPLGADLRRRHPLPSTEGSGVLFTRRRSLSASLEELPAHVHMSLHTDTHPLAVMRQLLMFLNKQHIYHAVQPGPASEVRI